MENYGGGKFAPSDFHGGVVGAGINQFPGSLEYNYSFIALPLAGAVDLVRKEHFRFGPELNLILRHLYKVDNYLLIDSNETFVTEVTGRNRTSYISGFGVYAATPFGRVIPKLTVGYLGNSKTMFSRYMPYARCP